VIDGSVPQQRRDVIVNDFQAGAYQTILLHPQTGAHGLTLTRGEACILLSPIYEADLLKQAIHRIYRGAQDKATDTVLVQARGTVEDLVYERRLEKTNNMNDFLALAATAQARRS
jgi:SNF2 family DNA or RNA helicase